MDGPVVATPLSEESVLSSCRIYLNLDYPTDRRSHFPHISTASDIDCHCCMHMSTELAEEHLDVIIYLDSVSCCTGRCSFCLSWSSLGSLSTRDPSLHTFGGSNGSAPWSTDSPRWPSMSSLGWQSTAPPNRAAHLDITETLSSTTWGSTTKAHCSRWLRASWVDWQSQMFVGYFLCLVWTSSSNYIPS